MQHYRNDGRLQARRALDGLRRCGLNPIAKASERAVRRKPRADLPAERVEGRITNGALTDRFDLSSVLVVISERRQRNLRISRLAVTQDQQAVGRHTLGQHVAAQHGGRQRRELREQRGQDGFAGSGHSKAGSLADFLHLADRKTAFRATPHRCLHRVDKHRFANLSSQLPAPCEEEQWQLKIRVAFHFV